MKTIKLHIIFIVSFIISGGFVLIVDKAFSAFNNQSDLQCVTPIYVTYNQYTTTAFKIAYSNPVNITKDSYGYLTGYTQPSGTNSYNAGSTFYNQSLVQCGQYTWGTVVCVVVNVGDRPTLANAEEYTGKITTNTQAQSTFMPNGCEDLNECPDAGTDAGIMWYSSLNDQNEICENDCKIQRAVDSTIEMLKRNPATGEVERTFFGEYTGETCTAGSTSPAPIDRSNDCEAVIQECEIICKGETLVNECNDEIIDCQCVSKPPPHTDSGDGRGLLPDTDKDFEPNIEDDDIDGDDLLNFEDPDVDGDGDPNIDDADVDDDGTTNGGILGWGKPAGTDTGEGFDDDIDGDGDPNFDDVDMDGDGTFNIDDDDMDGDGTLNEDDLDFDADGVPDGGGIEGDGEGVGEGTDMETSQDGQGDDGTGSEEDTDGDGEDDTWIAGNRNITFTPLVDASRGMSEKFPISLVKTVKGLGNMFLAPAEAPFFTGNVHGYEYTIDLSFWNPLAHIARQFFTLLCFVGIIMVINKQWSN